MERLIEDANKLRHAQGINNDLAIESYADVITAIHEVQTNMNITGTTAREASKTISGSIGAVKAAWTNLTIEMAKDDGDIDGAFQVLGENVGAVVDNMLPRVEKAIGGIGTMISKAAPQITNGLKQLLPRVLPTLLSTAGTLVSGVSTAVMESLPELMDIGGGLIDSFAGNSKYIFQSAQKMISNFADQLLNVDYGKLGKNISTIFTNAINSITDLIKDLDFKKVGENIAAIVSGVDWGGIIEGAFELIGAAVKGMPDLLKGVIENLDVESAMDLLALMTAPKLLTNMTNYINSEKGQAEGQEAGKSWSGAFMEGVKAFGLGWTIGTYLRDNVVIGDKTLGEWVDVGTEKTFDAIADNDVLNKTQFGSALKNLKDEANSDEAETFTTIDGREALMFNADGTLSNAYKKNAEKIAEKSTEAWTQYATSKAAEENRKKGWEAFRKYNYVGPVKPENNAIGNYITQPTLTWAAEKEPEYIIPESKMDKVFSREGVTININVSGADLVASDTVAQKIAETLANLSIRQQRAVGGTAW